MKEFWVTLVVIATLSLIPIGIGMAFYTGNETWLALCVVLVFFLS